MANTPTADRAPTVQNPNVATKLQLRSYEPEEFEADTQEERSIAMLAEKRRQFLAGLKARNVEAEAATGR